MNYEEKVICKKDKCDGALTVPIELLIEGTEVVDVARCPLCHKKYKFLLPNDDEDSWLPLIAARFFYCDNCGSDNIDNYKFGWVWQSISINEVYKHEASSPSLIINKGNFQQKVKITIKCRKCGKKRGKVISSELWSDLKNKAEEIKDSQIK